MTEREWLASADPKRLLGSVRPSASERKFRLALCGCVRRNLVRMPHPAFEEAVAASEAFADGLASRDELHDARWAAIGAAQSMGGGRRRRTAEAACTAATPDLWEAYQYPYLLEAAARAGRDQVAEQAALAVLIRDVFGNPHRPVAFEPAWRTETAVSLARQMYESRDFGAMTILADALQDAGCEDEAVLAHCRGSGPHVRGCWVVDLTLGRG